MTTAPLQATAPMPAGAPPLAGRTALVTGGGSGLGAAICDVLSEAGMRVVAADLAESRLDDVVGRLRESGRTVEPLRLDVSDAAAAEDAIGQVAKRYGGLDVLVNNAGIDRTASIEEMTVEEFDRIIAVNLRGPFVLARAALGRMREAGGGQIVNIVSTAAKRAWANASGYHASKWGLLGLSHAMHVEGREVNVKVTAVVAGGMRTPFLLDRFPDIDTATLQDPRTVAQTVRFVLAQPAESVIPEVMVLPLRETSWP